MAKKTKKPDLAAGIPTADLVDGAMISGRVGKHVAAVADVHVPEGSHAVDVLATVDVGERRALPSGEDQLRDRTYRRCEVTLGMEPVRPVELIQPAPASHP